ncbi:MAG: hypothetical protein ACRERD_08465 [Candidatus Binatia bacterium]
MKEDKTARGDKLRPEYELKSLEVRQLGPGRKSFGSGVIRLEPDVAALFPSAESVNEALRFLIRITQSSQPLREETKGPA